MKLRYLLLAGGTAFIVALLTQAPAALVYAWTFASRPDAPVRLYGVDGSVFAGRALQASRGPQPLLRQLQWTAKPWEMLLGRAAYHLKTDAPPMLLDGDVALGLGGTRVSSLKASGELRSVAAMFGQAFVPLSGQVGLQLDGLRIADDWPKQAEGEIRVIGLAWTLGREPVSLGDYLATITTDADGIVASISTLAGVVDVGGSGRVRPDHAYELDLTLRPRPDAPAMVTNLLRQLGSTDAQGNYHLRKTGSETSVAGTADAPPEAQPIAKPEPQAGSVGPRQSPAMVPPSAAEQPSGSSPPPSPAQTPAPDDENAVTF